MNLPRKLPESSGYKGLAGFHKYWGKKPLESLSFLIEELSSPGDVILDPFLGGALVSRLSLECHRRFVGFDLNPISIELGNLFVNLPDPDVFDAAFSMLESQVRAEIENSYRCSGSNIASHFLWEGDELLKIWRKEKNRRKAVCVRIEDKKKALEYAQSKLPGIRRLRMFDNSRINSRSDLGFQDLFTGRALRNIDLLLSAIDRLEPNLKSAFRLCLTAASGQMSKMVFAIENRGRKNSGKIEVGSWAVGFWRPGRHFEINVWNSFRHRVLKLSRAIRSAANLHPPRQGGLREVFQHEADLCLKQGSCLDLLKELPDKSMQLILTDPPHSDRIPYLEMSEFWNAILGSPPSHFKDEIVISNARDRKKSKASYLEDMSSFFAESRRVLAPQGALVLMFNTRDPKLFSNLIRSTELECVGHLPLHYSTGSLVQDSRSGALKKDHILIFSYPRGVAKIRQRLCAYAGWVAGPPVA